MRKSDGNKIDWVAEFQTFATAEELAPSAALSERVCRVVEHELNPPSWRVFAKLGAMQACVGFVVLLFCPQFGIALFDGMGLMTLFMRFGEAGCMMGCGSVFLGLGGLLAAFLLRPEEVRVIRGSRLLQVGLMGLVASAALICLAGELVPALGLAWVVGAVVGGTAALELAWFVRMRAAG